MKTEAIKDISNRKRAVSMRMNCQNTIAKTQRSYLLAVKEEEVSGTPENCCWWSQLSQHERKTIHQGTYTLLFSHSIVSESLQPHGLYCARIFCPWDFPGETTGVGCHFLLEGIFPTQGSYPCPLHWQIDSLPLSHQGCQRIYIGHKTNHMSKKLHLHSPQFFLFMKIK